MFYDNNLKAYASKCHFFSFTIQTNENKNQGFSTIQSLKSQKHLSVTIDSNFLFDSHITDLSHQTSQKIHALSGVASYMTSDKNQIIHII